MKWSCGHISFFSLAKQSNLTWKINCGHRQFSHLHLYTLHINPHQQLGTHSVMEFHSQSYKLILAHAFTMSLPPTHKVMHIYERGREWKTLSKLYCIWIYVYLRDFLSGFSQCLYFQFECMRRGRLFLNGSLLFSFLSYIFLHIKVIRNLIKIKQKICKFFCCITKTHPEKARKFNMSTFSSKKKNCW